MSAYLPKDSTGNSVYSEGGGLYALGMNVLNIYINDKERVSVDDSRLAIV